MCSLAIYKNTRPDYLLFNIIVQLWEWRRVAISDKVIVEA